MSLKFVVVFIKEIINNGDNVSNKDNDSDNNINNSYVVHVRL
jgi:hypothetical protein